MDNVNYTFSNSASITQLKFDSKISISIYRYSTNSHLTSVNVKFSIYLKNLNSPKSFPFLFSSKRDRPSNKNEFGNRINGAVHVADQPGYFPASHAAASRYRHLLHRVVLRLRSHQHEAL